jgi:tetratricopeptide (TPR) repeat protein
MKMIIMFCFAVVISACASQGVKPVTGKELDQEKRASQEQEIKNAQSEFAQMHFVTALNSFQKFEAEHLDSPFYFQAQVGHAQSLGALGQWSEAAVIYRGIVESTRQSQPELAAFSLYQLSYCYEALGEETKVYASLRDAESMKTRLSPEIAMAELPARLAASLYRMGRSKDAAGKLGEAERGLKELKFIHGSDGVSKEWLAQTYFQMGILSTNQLSMENFRPSLDTLRLVQIFSLRAVEEADPKWSPLAAETLSSTYRDLAILVDQVPLNRSLDHGAASRMQKDTKNQMAAQILESMQNLKTLRLTTESEPELLTTLYSSLVPIEAKLVKVLEKNPVQNELTPEAQRYQRARKDVMMKSNVLVPNEGGQGVPSETEEGKE